jgi:hypothetical protein
MGPFAPPPPPAPSRRPPGAEKDTARAVRRARRIRHHGALALEVTAFARPDDYGEHFKQRYGPTIATQANARNNGRDAEFEQALSAFCHESNLGTPAQARFEMEYLVAVGKRT